VSLLCGVFLKTCDVDHLFVVRCHECPTGKEHSWQAYPANQASNSAEALQDVPFFVWGRSFASATLWKLFVLMLLLTLTLKEMMSEVTGSATKPIYGWLSDKPGAAKRFVHQCTSYTEKLSKEVARRVQLVRLLTDLWKFQTALAGGEVYYEGIYHIWDALLLALQLLYPAFCVCSKQLML